MLGGFSHWRRGGGEHQRGARIQQAGAAKHPGAARVGGRGRRSPGRDHAAQFARGHGPDPAKSPPGAPGS